MKKRAKVMVVNSPPRQNLDASIKSSISIVFPKEKEITQEELKVLLEHFEAVSMEVKEDYYSSEASIERVRDRSFYELLKAYFYQKKNKPVLPFSSAK